MCDPVSGAMAFMAVMKTQQEQQAAMEQANAVNNAFEENNKMQVDAFNKDMEAYWDEEVNIQEEMHDNAEDAAEASVMMKIQQKSDMSSMLVANAETTAGGGGSPTALLGNLRRSQLNAARDLDEEFQAGVVALGGEREGLQRDKDARWNQAVGAINSAPTASYQSQDSKMMALGMAGGSAWVQGQAMQGKSMFPQSKDAVRGVVSTAGQGRHGMTDMVSSSGTQMLSKATRSRFSPTRSNVRTNLSNRNYFADSRRSRRIRGGIS